MERVNSLVTLADGRVVEVEHPSNATEAEKQQLAKEQLAAKGPSIVRTGAGIATEAVVGEGLKWGLATAGTVAGPIGSGVGYLAGGLIGGVSGSIARQRIMNPDKETSWGQVVGDTLLNLLPFGMGKGASVAKVAARGAGVGAGVSMGASGIETVVDEGRLPTVEELASAGLTGAGVGAAFGLTAKAFGSAYQKYAGMRESSLTEAFHAGEPGAVSIVEAARKANTAMVNKRKTEANEFINNWREKLDNEFHYVQKYIQKSVGGGQYESPKGLFPVDESTDWVMSARLSPGRKQSAMQSVDQLLQKDKRAVFNYAKDLGSTPDEIHQQIDKYLWAKHAPDYNKNRYSNAAGMDDDEAAAIVKSFESRGLHEQFIESIAIRKALSREILETRHKAGIITDEDYKLYRDESPNYVPLQRIIDSENPLEYKFAGRSAREITGTGIRRGEGSELDADITRNIVNNVIHSIELAETNNTNRHFLRMLRKNPDLAEENGFLIRKAVKKGKRKGKPAPIPRGYERRNKNFKPDSQDPRGHMLTVFDDGEKFFIDFSDTDHMRALKAIKGVNKNAMGPVMQGLSNVNRYIGSVYTKYNPSFVAPNLVRDRVESFINAAAKMPMKDAAKLLSPSAVRDEMATIRRSLFQVSSETPQDKALDALYREFKDAGGSTGGLALTTIDDIRKQIKKIDFKESHPVKARAESFNRLVNRINEVVEDSTRFATYRRAKEAGMSPSEAALAARDASFDPFLKGTRGDEMRALYLFSNPSIQGTKNIFRSIFKSKNSKKIQLMLGGSLLGSAVALDQWNSFVDPDWRDKVKGGHDKSGWRLNKNLIVLNPLPNEDGSLSYAQFPLPYPIVPAKTAVDGFYQAMTGDMPADFAKEVAKEVMSGYNPTGGSLMPTVVDKILQATSTNKDGLGRDIVPSYLLEQNLAPSEKIYPWTAETVGGELAIGLAEELQRLGAEVSPEKLLFLYNNAFGGAGGDFERLLTVVSKVFNGREITNNDLPLWRRFFGTTYADSFEERTGMEVDLKLYDYESNTRSSRARREAFSIFNRIKPPMGQSVDPQAYQIAVEGVPSSVRKRLDSLLKDRATGITKTDKQIRGLGVRDGTRASFYLSQLSKMPQDRAIGFLEEQKRKRILTEEVQRQMGLQSALQSMVPKNLAVSKDK